jgi:exoribonuclease R
MSLDQYPLLQSVNPITHTLFSRDVFEIVGESPFEIKLLHSNVKSAAASLAGVLVLEGNKTYGRTANKKRLYYKCIPDDSHLPAFLVPYDVTLTFSKVMINKYVVFRFDAWTSFNTHPYGILVETIGDVTSLEAFYEYQLYCKSLHISLTQFNAETNHILKQKKHVDYIDQILTNPVYKIEDRRDRKVFTIDPPNSLDFDDGFSIEKLANGDYVVSVYIANVFVWLETLGLWESFSQRVSTIYLPDRRRPMLPTILSDALCSLQEKQPRFAVVTDFVIDASGNVKTESYKNVIICAAKNYRYEQPALLEDPDYQTLLDLSTKMDKTNRNSHDVVTYWMVLVNKHCGRYLADQKTGIFRSSFFIHSSANQSEGFDHLPEDSCRVIRSWNNTVGQYILYTDDAVLDHEMMSIKSFKSEAVIKAKYDGVTQPIMKCYIHITSPIRRLVDLLNQIMLFRSAGLVTSISDAASSFLRSWIEKIDYINTAMRSIRKIQIDCDVLARCYSSPTMMDEEHLGVLFERIVRNDGMISYMVYLEKLKILSRITVPKDLDLPAYTLHPFKLFLFEDESKVKRKIRLQIIQPCSKS